MVLHGCLSSTIVLDCQSGFDRISCLRTAVYLSFHSTGVKHSLIYVPRKSNIDEKSITRALMNLQRGHFYHDANILTWSIYLMELTFFEKKSFWSPGTKLRIWTFSPKSTKNRYDLIIDNFTIIIYAS